MIARGKTPPESTEAVATLFKRHFGYTPPQFARAPGSLELLGSHADLIEGIALTAAINRYVHVAAGPRTDGRIELISSAFPGAAKFWVSEIKSDPETDWADLFKGILLALRKRGVNFSGFNAAIHSDIPIGLGLGSSAALQIAAALVVRALFPFSLTETGATLPPRRNEKGELPPLAPTERLHLARLCRAAELEMSGHDPGLVDLLTSLNGKAWHVLSVDCRFQTIEPLPLIGEVLVVCDSGARGEGGEDEAGILEACNSGARKLHAKKLRSVELAWLRNNEAQLDTREREIALHVAGDLARAVAAERCLREDDHRQFGQYLAQSHESSRELLRNSCEEVDQLVEIALARPGCLGARLVGSGHGGAVASLVSHHKAEEFIQRLPEEYEDRTGRRLSPMVCLPVAGAE